MNSKPKIKQVPLAEALQWRGAGNWLFEEKIDGCFQHLTIENALLAGEFVKSTGQYWAFDILEHEGRDICAWPTHERLALLDTIAPPNGERVGVRGHPLQRFNASTLQRPARGSGPEFLEAVLARGGEGIVAKPMDSPYGIGWFKAKRQENFYCRVVALPRGSQSVEICDSVTGEPRGRVALRAGKCDKVRLGSIIKVVGYGLTNGGRTARCIREPRPDTDTPTSWLVEY